MALTLRLKAKDGQHVLNQLTAQSTLEELKKIVSELTNIPAVALKIMTGFPPKPMDVSDDSKTLSNVPLRSGETLIVEENTALKAELARAAAEAEQKRTENILREVQSQYESGAGILTRQVVPANNSCLFTSVHFVMENGKLDLEAAPSMRQLIAGVVSGDPEFYNEAFLGRTNDEYCKWIVGQDSWGGAIEVSILSKYYNTEIDVVDTQSIRIDRFGEDQSYYRRALLIYDGIHYDPLMLESVDPSVSPKTIFSTADDGILQMALELASEAKASRQFTDVSQFSLRCLICQKALKGQSEAQDHAKTTGHINFGEY